MTQSNTEMYKGRYYIGTYEGRPAIYDKVLGLRAYGGTIERLTTTMHGLAEEDEWFAKNPATPSDSREHLPGGKYHGPSNEAGLTAREYQEMMDDWYAEQADVQAEASDYWQPESDDSDDDYDDEDY
jgi:hypothetical protein